MKHPALKIAFCCFFLLFFSPVFAQNLTGIWRGWFYTDAGDQYKYEMQIDNQKNSIAGVSYSYLDTRFYGKASLTGKFTKTTAATVIQETRTIELKMAGGSVACIMKCVMTYAKSGKEEFLEGTFTSAYETSNPYMGTKRGDNCGGGKVFLRKVPTSDFAPEPFLQKKTAEKTPVSKQTTPPATAQKKSTTTKPAAKPKISVTKTPNTNAVTPPVAVARPRVDSINRQTTAVAIEDKPTEKRVNIPITTRERKNELTKTLIVQNNEIELRLYDNGQIDNDTVSIYLDGKLILANKRLSDKPITYRLKLDESNPEHTVIMVAENLGTIPPNTSLMIVQDGDKRYQVSITSTEQKNAMVRFRYQKE